MTVNVHIERLVLDGVPLAPGGRSRLPRTVEAELTRLLARGGLGEGPLASRAVPDAGPVAPRWPGDGQPARLGEGIARAVYGSIRA